MCVCVCVYSVHTFTSVSVFVLLYPSISFTIYISVHSYFPSHTPCLYQARVFELEEKLDEKTRELEVDQAEIIRQLKRRVEKAEAEPVCVCVCVRARPCVCM